MPSGLDAEAQIWQVGRARGSNEFPFALTELEVLVDTPSRQLDGRGTCQKDFKAGVTDTENISFQVEVEALTIDGSHSERELSKKARGAWTKPWETQVFKTRT